MVGEAQLIEVNYDEPSGQLDFTIEANGIRVLAKFSGEFIGDQIGATPSETEIRDYFSRCEEKILKATLWKARQIADMSLAEQLPYVGTAWKPFDQVIVLSVAKIESD
jgi:hypothetical protein